MHIQRHISPKLLSMLLGLTAFCLLFWLLPSQPTTVRANVAPATATSGARVEPVILGGLQTRPDFFPLGVAIEKGSPRQPGQLRGALSTCSKTIDLTSTIRGVKSITAQENGICYNSDIDTYQRDGKSYVVQAGGWDAAWTHTDVTDPANPVLLFQSKWDRSSYTPDIKAFHQGDTDYIAISMERYNTSGYCGVAIYDVTTPDSPVLKSHIGAATDVDPLDWCDVHNLFVEDDANGDGAYIYITAMAPRDLRVLDISGQQGGSVTAPKEIGGYSLAGASYIHDVSVLDHTAASGGAVGRRVYIAYWERGLVILDAADVTPGYQPTPLVGGDVIDPAGFRTHHAMANPDGSLVFIQDEFILSNGSEPVQMWNVTDLANPVYVDGLEQGSDVPRVAAHNLETPWDLFPNRLFVGWYKLGLQAWDYTSTGFVREFAPPYTAKLYHQVQTGATDHVYSGAWGVRLATIDDDVYIFQSDYRYGLIIDCLDCSHPETPTPMPTETETATHTPSPLPSATKTRTPTATATATTTTTATVSPTVTVTGTITSTATPTETITPTTTPQPTVISTVTPTGTVPSTSTMPLTASQTFSLTIDADKDGLVSPGDLLHFEVLIKNASDAAVSNASFSEHFGPYLGVLRGSVTASNGTMVKDGTVILSRVDFAFASIAPSETVTITFDAALSQFTPLSVGAFNVQGTVSVAGVEPITTDNPESAPLGDPNVIVVHHAALSEHVYLPIVAR